MRREKKEDWSNNPNHHYTENIKTLIINILENLKTIIILLTEVEISYKIQENTNKVIVINKNIMIYSDNHIIKKENILLITHNKSISK